MKNDKSLIDEYIKEMDNIIYPYGEYDNIIKDYCVREGIGSGKIKRFKINESININLIKAMTIDNWLEFGLDGFSNILEISYCFKGKTEMFVEPEAQAYIIKKGDLILHHNRNGKNTFRFKYKNLDSLSIHIDLGKIVDLGYDFNFEKFSIEEIMDGKNLMITAASEKLIAMADGLRDMKVNNINDYFQSKLMVTNFFIEALDFLVLNKQLSQEEQRLIDSIIKDLDDRLFEEIKMDNILVKYELTEYKLQKLFKSKYKTTFYQYLKRRRIERSLSLLSNSDMKIIDISQAVGYSNPSKYTEAFKSIMNTTPNRYRKLGGHY